MHSTVWISCMAGWIETEQGTRESCSPIETIISTAEIHLRGYAATPRRRRWLLAGIMQARLQAGRDRCWYSMARALAKAHEVFTGNTPTEQHGTQLDSLD